MRFIVLTFGRHSVVVDAEFRPVSVDPTNTSGADANVIMWMDHRGKQ